MRSGYWIIFAALFLAYCANPRQFSILEETDPNGTEVLITTPIPISQGGYPLGLSITAELRDTGISQTVFLHFESSGKKLYEYSSVSVTIGDVPLYFSELLQKRTANDNHQFSEQFTLEMDLRDLKQFADSRFIRLNGEKNSLGFSLENVTRQQLRQFYELCEQRINRS